MYGSAAGVEALLPSIPTLTTLTTPKLEEVTTWLTEGAARIDRVLASRGWSVPVDAVASVYPELTSLNNLYGGAMVLRSLGIQQVSGTEETRDVTWLKEFNESLTEISKVSPTSVGAEAIPSTTTSTRRASRSRQLRRIDGYSSWAEGSLFPGE
jgi:hypothetical protein